MPYYEKIVKCFTCTFLVMYFFFLKSRDDFEVVVQQLTVNSREWKSINIQPEFDRDASDGLVVSAFYCVIFMHTPPINTLTLLYWHWIRIILY